MLNNKKRPLLLTAVTGSVGTLIPLLCKRITMMPQVAYYILSALFFILTVISIILVLRIRNNNKGSENWLIDFQWPIYSAVLSGMFLICTFIYPAISVPDNEELARFELQTERLQRLQKLADEGDVNSMLKLGGLYLDPSNGGITIGDLTFVDYGAAEKYFEMAADSRSADAYVLLSEMKRLGLGRRVSKNRAIEELRKAIQIDPENRNLINSLRHQHYSEKDFPEGNLLLKQYDEKIEAEEHINQLKESILINRVDSVLTRYQALTQSPIDSLAMAHFCKEAIPILESVSISGIDLNEYLAWMYFYCGDNEKGFEYSKRAAQVRNQPLDLYLALFSERQEYGQSLRQIDSVFNNTLQVILEVLYRDREELLLDPYYVVGLQAELAKKEHTSNATATIDSLKKVINTLCESYTHQTLSLSPRTEFPVLKVSARPDYQDGNIWLRVYTE